ncbi:hypothetical protein JCM33374_g6467 [Metschnikowia sp. JCM 33374]|nr:hypothetical protein JCM33374_g6467 [Metschnikowia sp. JCM 33374]
MKTKGPVNDTIFRIMNFFTISKGPSRTCLCYWWIDCYCEGELYSDGDDGNGGQRLVEESEDGGSRAKSERIMTSVFYPCHGFQKEPVPGEPGEEGASAVAVFILGAVVRAITIQPSQTCSASKT